MKSVVLALFWALLLLAGSVEVCLGRGLNQTVPPGDYFPIYDYDQDWLVYHPKYENFVPFSKDIDQDSRSVSVYVDLIKNRRYFLMLHTTAENYLFVEGALQKRLEADQWLKLSIDSLYQIYKRDELLVTLYGSPGIEGKTLLICNQKDSNFEIGMTGGTNSLINIKPIITSPFGDFSVIVVLLILFLCGLLFNYNQAYFMRLINPYDFFSYSERDGLPKIYKPYNTLSILFVLILSMVLAYVFIYLNDGHIHLLMISSLLSDGSNLWELLRDFGVLTIGCFLVLFLKYTLMLIVGNMLNLDQKVDVLFLKIVQSSFIFHSVLFMLIWSLSMHFPGWDVLLDPYLHFPFLVFYFLRFCTLYLLVNPSDRFINLYLFSYLCVVEVIPLIIGIKFAI
ncbi:uncharacterized protein DUF4271 [Dyadobacter jejuensis]|uniref:Uncharacterized protein DUF4271 n=1 Tax=Dyadobacter jejuensis TaxID=1082580 RepID=A0A316AST9_9BACT|nr:DUF4271 domain-containing protein [Dyadobacter jejuensis]PWJ60588.1 uncharacterized protein DUF4271 [Dyadobacter jejuensis]